MLVTHHVEEIPPGVTHAALLRGGRLVSAGPVDEVLRTEPVSAAFGVAVTVEQRDGRWSARAVPHGSGRAAGRGDRGPLRRVRHLGRARAVERRRPGVYNRGVVPGRGRRDRRHGGPGDACRSLTIHHRGVAPCVALLPHQR